MSKSLVEKSPICKGLFCKRALFVRDFLQKRLAVESSLSIVATQSQNRLYFESPKQATRTGEKNVARTTPIQIHENVASTKMKYTQSWKKNGGKGGTARVPSAPLLMRYWPSSSYEYAKQ